jgi:hypothetical protein
VNQPFARPVLQIVFACIVGCLAGATAHATDWNPGSAIGDPNEPANTRLDRATEILYLSRDCKVVGFVSDKNKPLTESLRKVAEKDLIAAQLNELPKVVRKKCPADTTFDYGNVTILTDVKGCTPGKPDQSDPVAAQWCRPDALDLNGRNTCERTKSMCKIHDPSVAYVIALDKHLAPLLILDSSALPTQYSPPTVFAGNLVRDDNSGSPCSPTTPPVCPPGTYGQQIGKFCLCRP